MVETGDFVSRWSIHDWYLTSQRSQFSASFMRSWPRMPRPLDHSSAAAGPKAKARFNSLPISSTWGL